jgi:hypothetical protein
VGSLVRRGRWLTERPPRGPPRRLSGFCCRLRCHPRVPRACVACCVVRCGGQGLATAPVLFASYANPGLLEVIARKFEAPDDVQHACDLVQSSHGVDKTRHLAYAHAQKAIDALQGLPDSPFRTSLAALAHAVVHRSK